MLQCKAYMVQGRTRRGPTFSCANSYYTMRARSTARNAPVTLLVWLNECETTATPLPGQLLARTTLQERGQLDSTGTACNCPNNKGIVTWPYLCYLQSASSTTYT
jgi:hypothetical protein